MKEDKNISILTLEGYFDFFFEMSSEERTYRDAYKRTEEVLIEKFGVRRYSSYDSFRQMKSRFLKPKT